MITSRIIFISLLFLFGCVLVKDLQGKADNAFATLDNKAYRVTVEYQSCQKILRERDLIRQEPSSLSLTLYNLRDTLYKSDVEFLYVEDFGAKGDGITDDYVSIQKAIDAAINQKKALKFQGKKYLVNKQLEIKQGSTALRLIGYPNSVDVNRLTDSEVGGTVIIAGDNMQSILVLRSVVDIYDLAFNGAFKASNCLRLRGCSNSTFRNCRFLFAKVNGVLLNAPNDLESKYTALYHINDNNTFENCVFEFNGQRHYSSNCPQLGMALSQLNTSYQKAYAIVEKGSDTVFFKGINLNKLGIQTMDFVQLDTLGFKGTNNEITHYQGQYAILEVLDSNTLRTTKPYISQSKKSIPFSIGIGSQYRENGHSDNNTNDIIGGLARQSGSTGFRFSSPYGPNVTGVQFDAYLFPAICIGAATPNVTFGAKIYGNYFEDSPWECPIAVGKAVYELEIDWNVGLGSYPNDINQPPILYTCKDGIYAGSTIRGSKIYSIGRQLPWRKNKDYPYPPNLTSEVFSAGLIDGRMVGHLSFGQPVGIEWVGKTFELQNFHMVLRNNTNFIKNDTIISDKFPFMSRPINWRTEFSSDSFDMNNTRQYHVRVTNELGHSLTLLGNQSFPKTNLRLPFPQVVLENNESAVFMEHRNLGSDGRNTDIEWRLLYIESTNGNATNVKRYENEKNIPNVSNKKWNKKDLNLMKGSIAFQEDKNDLKVFNGQDWNSIAQDRTLLIEPTKDTTVILTNETIIIANAEKGNITIKIYPISNNSVNKKISIIKTDSTNKQIIVQANSNEKINGAQFTKLKAQYENISIVSDGKLSWFIINNRKP